MATKGNKSDSEDHYILHMRRPPVPVVIVVLFDLFALTGSLLSVDQIGLLGGTIEIAIFGTLIAGLWALKRWAWFAEMALSVLQIVLLLAGIGIVFFGADQYQYPNDFSKETVYGMLAALLVSNVVVLVLLSIPKVRVQFR